MTDLDFLVTTEASHSQIYIKGVPQGLYIQTGNDVISYIQSAANHVNATTAADDFKQL